MGRDRISRRHVLGILGSSGVGTLAGCGSTQFDATSPTTSAPSSETIVFTDKTTTPADSPAPPTATTQRSTPDPIVFDGGDARDFQAALRLLGDTPGATLEIEPGTYHFEPAPQPQGVPDRGAHFMPQHLEDVTVEGNGATLVGTQPHMGLIHFLHGANLTVRNLTVDYDPVPFTQGTITEVSEGTRSFILDLDDGYPLLTHDMFDIALNVAGNVYTADGEFISGVRDPGGPFKYFSAIDHVAGRTFELALVDLECQLAEIEPGRRMAVTVRGAPDRGPGHALLFNHVDRPRIENVTVRTASNMAIVLKQCNRPVATGVTVAPPPGSGRLSGSVGDGIHAVNCDEGPIVEDSRLEFVGDDAIVVNTLMLAVTDVVDDRTIEVPDVPNVHVQIGDVLEAMAVDGVRKGSLPPVADAKYRREYPKSWAPGRPRELTFEESIADTLETGDFLANRASANRNFVLRNNVVRDSIANPVRIAAGPGRIEGNELHGCARHGIWFRCDTTGHFSPKRWSNDVVVRDNHVTDTGMRFFAGPEPEAIQAVYWAPDDVTATGRPHRHLEFVDNEIAHAAHMGIRLGDVEHVTVSANALRDLNKLGYAEGGYGIGLENVVIGEITDNRVEGTEDAISKFGYARESREITSAGNELILDGEPASANLI